MCDHHTDRGWRIRKKTCRLGVTVFGVYHEFGDHYRINIHTYARLCLYLLSLLNLSAMYSIDPRQMQINTASQPYRAKSKDKEKEKEKKARSSQKPQVERRKTVVRRLPPNLPEDIFWQSVQSWVSDETVTWKVYQPGKFRKRYVISSAVWRYRSNRLLSHAG